MKAKNLTLCLCVAALAQTNIAQAQENEKKVKEVTETDKTEVVEEEIKIKKSNKKKRNTTFTLGAYGEAVMTRNFFSDKYLRYTDAEKYKDDKGHGRFDLPHFALWMGFDFGKGWSVGAEIEFEHGGTESAVEIEAEEGGEYESEIERGGEVALEQLWVQKSFNKAFNLRMGHVVVPVGGTNAFHSPDQFFTNYRPEGENGIMPCTWHETGISLWGEFGNGQWKYELQFLPGLDSDRFGSQHWVKGGAGSPYEFKIANNYAGAFRLDNFSVKNLRLSLSGYFGNSFGNSLKPSESEKFAGVKGTVMIGAFDFCYDNSNVIVRGNFDYGHLTDSDMITKFNMGMRKDSPSPKQPVASDAIAGGVEAGYDFFSLNSRLKEEGHRFFLFGRYEYYDSMFRTMAGVLDLPWCARHRIAFGINYSPVKSVIIKAEYSHGFLAKQFNNEPSISLGVTFNGLFVRTNRK